MTLVAGIDIGAGTAKTVIFAEHRIVSYSVLPTGYDPVDTARKTMSRALRKAALKPGDVERIVTTGYSRAMVPFADRTATEIMCHARGANHLFPSARTVIDIGCQDSKAMRIDEHGMVTSFAMNDKCAAGTGRFIEVMAHTLALKIEDVGSVALLSTDCCNISSTCTVFAETEIVSQRALGRSREDLIAGALRSIARRVSIMASGIGMAREVVFTGGVAKNIGVKKALEETLEVEIHIPEEPQITGALGAALFAADDLEQAVRGSLDKKH